MAASRFASYVIEEYVPTAQISNLQAGLFLHFQETETSARQARSGSHTQQWELRFNQPVSHHHTLTHLVSKIKNRTLVSKIITQNIKENCKYQANLQNKLYCQFTGPQPDFRTRRDKFRAPKARAARQVWGHAPPEHFEIWRFRNALLSIFRGIFPQKSQSWAKIKTRHLPRLASCYLRP